MHMKIHIYYIKLFVFIFFFFSQKLPSPHHDAAGIQLSNHLPALNDETGETNLQAFILELWTQSITVTAAANMSPFL